MKRILLTTLLAAVVMLTASAQYRDVKLPEKPQQRPYKTNMGVDKGFWHVIEAEGGSSVMANRTNAQFATLTWTGGYRFSEFLRVGAGVGVRMYVHNAQVRDTDNKFGVPIFANARGNFMATYDRDGVPFWSVNIGGMTNEGFFVSPTVGYSFGGLRNNFQIGLSYSLNCFRDYTKKNTAYSYVGLKLGYEF